MKRVIQLAVLSLSMIGVSMAEELATKKTLTLAVAKKIAAAAEAEALANKWNVVITILDEGGNLLYLQRMDGTQIGSIDVAIAKGASAVKFKRPTKVFEEALKGGRQAILKLPGAIPVEGGLPLTVDGQILGAIGVSGVQSNEDGQIATAGVNALPKIIGR
ncbi:MAG: heme-binding protein [Bryobacteraceae bacterium]